MKISVVLTTLNEGNSISPLIESLLSQTHKANEIVIVDGGSTDDTIQTIKSFQKKHKLIKLYVKNSATIAQGRNLAINKAENEIIAMTDAGCIIKKDWLEKITKPFLKKDTELVAGYYIMTGKSNIQKVAKIFLGILPQNYNVKTFLPSARSMAFTKTFWEKTKGFSEEFTYAGEDTHFNFKALKARTKIVRVKNAIVYWEVPYTLTQLQKKLFLYAIGDAQMFKITREFNHHTFKILSLYVRYFIFIIIPLLFLIYLYFIFNKFKKIEKTWQMVPLIFIIQIVSDFSVMAGFIYGLQKRNN